MRTVKSKRASASKKRSYAYGSAVKKYGHGGSVRKCKSNYKKGMR